MIAGFKEFISRGNVVDMAVGLVIGAAFAAIVDALVKGILMPIIAGIFGTPDFNKVGSFTINGAVVMPGMVITAIINFLLVAIGIYFLFVVPINKLRAIQKARRAAETEVPEEEIQILSEIRDLLRNQNNVPPTA